MLCAGSRGVQMWRVFRLLLSLLPAVCRAYQVVEVVEGRLAADEANHYTVRTTGVLVGMVTRSKVGCVRGSMCGLCLSSCVGDTGR